MYKNCRENDPKKQRNKHNRSEKYLDPKKISRNKKVKK